MENLLFSFAYFFVFGKVNIIDVFFVKVNIIDVSLALSVLNIDWFVWHLSMYINTKEMKSTQSKSNEQFYMCPIQWKTNDNRKAKSIDHWHIVTWLIFFVFDNIVTWLIVDGLVEIHNK